MDIENQQKHIWKCDKCGNMISSEPCQYCNKENKIAESEECSTSGPTELERTEPIKNNSGYKIFIKTLIWLACFVIYIILNTLLAVFTGFRFGYLITILVVPLIAKKICDNWEKNFIYKRSVKKEKNTTFPEVPPINTNNIEKCSEKQEDNSIILTEPTVEFNYKTAKKIAKQNFKEQKKKLKNEYSTQNNKSFVKYKIAIIILSVLFVGATIANIAQFIYNEEYCSDLYLEKRYLEEKIEELEDEISRKDWIIDDYYDKIESYEMHN